MDRHDGTSDKEDVFSSSSVGTNTKGYGQEQHCPLESQEKSDNSGLTPISGKKAVRYTRRYPMPMLLKSPANMSHVTLRGIVEKNPTVAFPSLRKESRRRRAGFRD